MTRLRSTPPSPSKVESCADGRSPSLLKREDRTDGQSPSPSKGEGRGEGKILGTPYCSRMELLRRFVEMYWLRPENALWMTLRSLALRDVELSHPSIDLGCGDGVFSFLHMGGAFDPAFDVFTSVDHLDKVRTSHADMFDSADTSYQPRIHKQPTDRFDVGADFKASMLAKAGALNFYTRLSEQDNNKPLRFESGSFTTVYCNAAYWVKNIDGFLAELARIANPNGRIVLQVKLDSMKRYTLSKFEAALGAKFLDLIDRGRMDCWPSLTDRKSWESRFARAGLSISSATPFVTRTHSHMWDIGLRPIAPQLVRMANALTPQTRTEIKRDWVDLFCDLLTPFCDPALDLFPGTDELAEIQYVLEKR